MKPLRGEPRDSLKERIRIRRETEEFWREVQSIMHNYALSIQSRSQSYAATLYVDSFPEHVNQGICEIFSSHITLSA